MVACIYSKKMKKEDNYCPLFPAHSFLVLQRNSMLLWRDIYTCLRKELGTYHWMCPFLITNLWHKYEIFGDDPNIDVFVVIFVTELCKTNCNLSSKFNSFHLGTTYLFVIFVFLLIEFTRLNGNVLPFH